MFATNELPKIRDATDGIWRRMILVPFAAKFSGDEQNPSLSRELQEPKELAGILNWMIEGAEILRENGGFIRPTRSVNAIEQYRNESSSARLYLIDQVEIDGTRSCPISTTWLHQQYQKYCADNGFKPLNNVHFGKTLRTLYHVQKIRISINGTKTMCYSGIRPQPNSELDTVYSSNT